MLVKHWLPSRNPFPNNSINSAEVQIILIDYVHNSFLKPDSDSNKNNLVRF